MPFTVPYTLKPVKAPSGRTLSKGSSVSSDDGLQSPRSPAWSRSASIEDRGRQREELPPSSSPSDTRGRNDDCRRGSSGGEAAAAVDGAAPGGGGLVESVPLQRTATKGKEETRCSGDTPTASQNSDAAEAARTAADDAGGSDPKDVEKERHYNSFMEARLKLGQTRTVAEPLSRLKARQQEPPAPEIMRRGSVPVFSQAMLRRPSERRLSSVKAKVVPAAAGSGDDGGGGSSEIDGVTSARDVKREGEEVATPGAAPADRKTSPPTKSPRSSPSKTTGMSIASTTVVTTLGDLGRRDSSTGTPARRASGTPVTTLRITKKPSATLTKKTETSDTPSQPDAAATKLSAATAASKQCSATTAAEDVKKPFVADNKASELRKAASPPKKTSSATAVPPRRKSLRIRTSVTVEECGTAETKPATPVAEQPSPPKAAATAATGTVSKGGEKPGTVETLRSAPTNVSTPIKDSKTTLPGPPTVAAATTPTVTAPKDSPVRAPQHSVVQQSPTSVQPVVPKHADNCTADSTATTTKEKERSESKLDRENVVSTNVNNKTSDKQEKEEHVVTTKESKSEEKMQTVDIRDLRILLRTPSPLPPKSSSPTSRGSSCSTVTITPGRLDSGSRKGSLSSLASRNGSTDGPEDVSEASTSGVSSLSGCGVGGFRRDSLASSRPSSLSWDSDAALSSTATSTPSDAVGGPSLRSRSVSVESAADGDDAACPRAWSSHVHPGSLQRLSVGSRSHGGSGRRTRLAQQPPSPSSRVGGTATTAWVTSPGKPWWSTRMSPRSSQVSDLWADLGQEQAASAQAAEMLEAETAERLRLDKEVRELQARCSQLQQQKDRMEMEAMETRMLRSAELNGDVSDDEDAAGSIYKQKYERALREAEMAKRKLSQQHEDDLEKQMLARKATEKRLNEALADLDEGRQAVNQWKRKAQKLSTELQDLKLLVEEHMARNAELERKQRRFDSELGQASEGLKQERQQREKLQRDRDLLCAEKQALEQELVCCRAELDSQHERVNSLRRELDELSFNTQAEEEVAKLKRAKQELERKSRDQEEELEDLASQVALLEQSKLRLEMALEKARQEHRRELSQRDEEADEARASSAKKLRNLESLLESEQEERQCLQRQRQDLERRLAEMSERPPPRDPQVERRLRRDLRRTRALLQDAQLMLDSARSGQANRSVLRQLKSQLEDAEFAKSAAIKARQGAEAELEDVQSQLEEVLRTKNEAESRCLQLAREKGALQVQLEEMEEEQAELMKKYKSAVQQMQSDQKLMIEQTQQILDLESEKHHLKEQVQDLNSKMDHLASQAEDSHAVRRLEAKVRELESRLELEQTAKARLESQVQRLKEQCARLQEESEQASQREQQGAEACRRLQRQMRELREDCTQLQQREAEAQQRCHELEMSLEGAEVDLQATRQDLKLACQRIHDLQAALEEDLDSGTDVAEDESDSDSDNDVDIDTLLRRHGLGSQSRLSSLGDMSPLPMTSSRRSSAAVSLNRMRVPSLDYPL